MSKMSNMLRHTSGSEQLRSPPRSVSSESLLSTGTVASVESHYNNNVENNGDQYDNVGRPATEGSLLMKVETNVDRDQYDLVGHEAS